MLQDICPVCSTPLCANVRGGDETMWCVSCEMGVVREADFDPKVHNVANPAKSAPSVAPVAAQVETGMFDDPDEGTDDGMDDETEAMIHMRRRERLYEQAMAMQTRSAAGAGVNGAAGPSKPPAAAAKAAGVSTVSSSQGGTDLSNARANLARFVCLATERLLAGGGGGDASATLAEIDASLALIERLSCLA